MTQIYKAAKLLSIALISIMIEQIAMGQNETAITDKVTIPVKEIRSDIIGEKLEISFEVELDTLKIPSNRFIRLVPAIIKGDSVTILKPFTIAGRRQYIMRERKETEPMLAQRKNKTTQSFEYHHRIQRKNWMNGAQLVLTQDLCGCGGKSLGEHQAAISAINFDNRHQIVPVLAFVKPQVEIVKTRYESGRAFLDFPVNEIIIYPDYRQNKTEIEKITSTIDKVKNDPGTSIKHIHIHGFASPEGSFENNCKLAQDRAEALKQYVCQLYHFQDSTISVESTPEDWEGLAKWVAESDIANKKEIQRVLDSKLGEDAKNWALQLIDSGKVYKRLLKEVYPALRHSDYTVTFTVRAFELEEAKKLLKQRPQLLSLEEMYAVAATYEPGSDEFNEVFDIAVRMFPEDETANLNAAMVAIKTGEYKKAENYLNKAGNSPEATHARGVLFMMTDRYEVAEEYLKLAETQGVNQATANLKLLEESLKN